MSWLFNKFVERFHFLLVGILLTSAALQPVAAENTSFLIIANVVEPSCSVVASDLHLTIEMPTIEAGKLESTGQSDTAFFNIRFEKCDGQKSATIKFNSQYADGNGHFYPIDGQQWGYVLGFTDESGELIPLGKEKKEVLSGGTNTTLTFGVLAKKSSGSLHSGPFKAMATATISYL